jgi:sulfite exporter TauE/SafE
MTDNLIILLLTTASIGFIHTILGPDHYFPFIGMSRSGKWSIKKTVLVTSMCGVAHVLSSGVLGLLGAGLGFAAVQMDIIESVRGHIAGWALIAFGLAYMVWGIKIIIRKQPHIHSHIHVDGSEHNHKHEHYGLHAHVHKTGKTEKVTPWILFLIFILGPCEPLIPLLMYPAMHQDIMGVITVSVVFASVTILTMLTIVLMSVYGLNRLPSPSLNRYTHALTGVSILMCGVAMQFWGL